MATRWLPPVTARLEGSARCMYWTSISQTQLEALLGLKQGTVHRKTKNSAVADNVSFDHSHIRRQGSIWKTPWAIIPLSRVSLFSNAGFTASFTALSLPACHQPLNISTNLWKVCHKNSNYITKDNLHKWTMRNSAGAIFVWWNNQLPFAMLKLRVFVLVALPVVLKYNHKIECANEKHSHNGQSIVSCA